MPQGKKAKTTSQRMDSINLGSDYTADEWEFLKAIEAYKAINNRKFPTFTEVLAVAKSCGWRKVEKAEPMPVYREEG